MHLNDFPTRFNGMSCTHTKTEANINNKVFIKTDIEMYYVRIVLPYFFVIFHSIYNIYIPAIQPVGKRSRCMFN